VAKKANAGGLSSVLPTLSDRWLGKPELPITYVENEMDAIDHVLATAPDGAVITLLTENIAGTLKKLDEYEASLKEG
jgi:cyanophycin synthetase